MKNNADTTTESAAKDQTPKAKAPSRGVYLATMPIYRIPHPQVNGRQTPFAAVVPRS